LFSLDFHFGKCTIIALLETLPVEGVTKKLLYWLKELCKGYLPIVEVIWKGQTYE